MLDMYQEAILDHYKHPLNTGEITNATFAQRELNPLCGDAITVTGIVNDHDLVTDIKFIGTGCAISQAAMSMLTDHVKEKTLDEIREIDAKHIVAMLGIPIGPVRLKCATLGLKAIHKAIGAHDA